MSTELSYEWRESITSIPRREWQRCFRGSGFARSYTFQEAVEASTPEGVSFHHLVVRKDGETLAIIGCFRYQLPLAVIATGAVRRAVAFIERFKPGLFSVNAFFVGQLTAVCDHLFGLDGIEPNSDLLRRVVKESDRKIREKARQLGCALTVVKEIPENDFDLYSSLLGDEYVVADSLPNTFLSFDPSRSYFEQIRSKYRNLYRKRTRALRERGLVWEVVDGPVAPERAREMERLYLRVMQRSDNQFERMPAEFFAALCAGYVPAFAIFCFDAGKLVGFSVNVDDEDKVCGLYLGYEDDTSGEVYFNLLYKVIEVAMERGKNRLQLGQTSYEVKSALGAVASRTYLALHSRHRFVRLLLEKLKHQLFPTTPFPQRRVFAGSGPQLASAVGA